MSIGVAAPVFEAGTMAAMSAAWSRKKPALAARAPLGATYAITGTLRAQLGLRDLAHRRQQPARRVELEHDGVVVGAPGGVDLVDDPVGRHGVDVGVEHDHPHVRSGGRGARREREPGDEGDGQEAQCAHRRPQPIPAGGASRDAAAAGEAGVVRRALIRCLPVVAALLALAPAAHAAATRYGELTVGAPGTAGSHVLPPQRAPFAFDLVGARWNAHPGVTVAVRARAAAGPWSPWTTLDADPGGAVAHADPVWLAGSRVLQVRVGGPLRRVHIALVAADRSPLRHLRTLAAPPGEPAIISRAGWGADETLNRAPPRYAEATHMVFIHHTDTPNGYAAADVPAIIRSIYVYHVRSNGWNDIGYNFLVDAYGRIFEGRAGGVDRPVIGAHTMGFNTGSVGIAVIGNGALAPLTTATRDALTSLIAWRLDLAHVDPLGHATLVSAGNDRYPAGKSVTFRVVSGHRDALSTDCPGALIYADLDAIAAAAQATGSPKIVDASATPPGLGADAAGALVPIAFRARVIGGAGWTVTVLDAHGAAVASGSGSGETVAWNWNGERSDGTPLAPGTKLAYRIEAHDATGVSALPVLASLGAEPGSTRAPPLALSTTVISPDGDGVDDAAVIGYTLAEPVDRHARRRWRRTGPS